MTEPGPGRLPGPLALLRQARRRTPSPEVPQVRLALRGEGVEVALQVQDAEGRAILGQEERRTLGILGWRADPATRSAAVSRLLPSSSAAAEVTTRVLVEVLRVPHPADLRHTIRLH